MTNWNLGLDLGTNSLGYAAVEYADGSPERILFAGSIIHTGGQDRQESYKSKAGKARRSRNRYQQLRKNRKDMDRILRDNGFPSGEYVVEDAVDKLVVHDPFDVRAALADGHITDDETRELAVSCAVRHMQQRRGQRNSWVSEAFVKDEATQGYSEMYQALRQRCSELSGEFYGELTPAQLISRTRKAVGAVSTKALAVDFFKDLEASESPKAKDTLDERLSKRRGKLKNDKDRIAFDKQAHRLNTYLTRQGLRRSDFIRELNVIAEVQKLDKDFVNAAASLIIFQEHPGKGVKERVGQDELPLEGKREPRAQRSSLVFQEFRIATTVANLRHVNGEPLSADDRKTVKDFLNTWDDTESLPTWTDVSEQIGVPRVKGHDDLSRPPVNQTLLTVLKSGGVVRDFWTGAGTSDAHRQALLDSISHERVLDISDTTDFLVQKWINTLNEEDILTFDKLKFEPGRAAHSATTMRSLLEHMNNTNCDEHIARREVFGVPDGWRPAPNPLGTTVGNPTVDANIRLVKRVFDKLVFEIGSKPQRVVIESTRDITSSPSTREQTHRDNAKRKSDNDKMLANLMHTYKATDGDVRTRAGKMRLIILTEQNGACLYCGDTLTRSAMEIDHIVPRSRGGGSNRLNLAGVCRGCNHSKGNTPFVEWAGGIKSDVFTSAAARIKTMTLRGPARQQSKWKKTYLAQLKTSEADRPIESLSWAAVEVKNQIAGVLDDPSNALLVSGRISSSVRKMGKIDTEKDPLLLRVPNTEPKGKSRVDRRHHAVDAAVLTTLRQRNITVLSERNILREEASLNAVTNGDTIALPDVVWFEEGKRHQGQWRDYSGATAADRLSFAKLKGNLDTLRELLRDAVGDGTVTVTSPVRWTPRTGGIHEETVRPLNRIRLGDAIPADVIDRASSPQLWTALTRLTDYDPKSGLPADDSRTIRVKEDIIGPDDDVTYFPGNGGALALRGGYADAPTIHHFRVAVTTTPRGQKKYHVIRVYQFDAARLHQTGKNVFSTPLDSSTLSMRDAGLSARAAFHNSEWKVIVPGDELVFTPEQIRESSVTALRSMSELFPDETEYRYRVTSFGGDRPIFTNTVVSVGDVKALFPKVDGDDQFPPLIKSILSETKSVISGLEGVRVDRRDILGQDRNSGSVMLRSYVL